MRDVRPRAPGSVKWVARTLEEAGYETWAVGGAVRNTLLGLPEGDWDLTTRARPQAVRRLFPRTVPVGIEHGTVGVLTRQGNLLEVTTFRRDVETSGRHAVVEFAETLEEDLARRDFTVNAIAWHPLREEFFDPFGGREDLSRGVLRTVGDPWDRFREDYLRILRGLRFSGRFRLRISDDTWQALCGCTDGLKVLSAERVREELLKVLELDPQPSGALSLYRAAGVIRILFPELETSVRNRRAGGAETVWEHALLLADALSPQERLLRLAAVLDAVDREEWDPAAVLFRLRFSNREIREVAGLLEVGLEPPVHLGGPAELRRWLHRADPDRLGQFGRLWLAKARLDRARWGTDPSPVLSLLARLRREKRSGAPLRLADLALGGRDLIAMGLKPGPEFGTILETLMERVLEEPGLNEPESLRDLVRRELAP